MNTAQITFMICISALTSNAIGNTIVENKQTFTNVQCELNDTCDLESFYVKTISQSDNKQGHTYMSSGFKTSDNSALQKYAIVQFHQGCIYKASSPVELLTRTYMGIDGVPFIHPQMVVDSAEDADPIYQSSPRGGQDDGFGYIFPRKEFYFTFEPNFLGERAPQDSYMNHLENEEVTELHVSDVPTFSDLTQNQVASLNFITCLYKIEDVPRFMDDPSLSKLAGAIKCFDWNHNWKINSKNILERTTDIDPVCLQGEKK